MATKTIYTPSNVTQTASSFTKNAQGYYTGTANFRCDSGFTFDEPALSGTAYSNYNVLVTRTNGTTFNIKSTSYITFSKPSASGEQQDRLLTISLKAAAQINDDSFNLRWELQPSLTQSARELTVNKIENNATISGLPSTVTDATDLQLTATAASGYEFNAAPFIQFDKMILDENGNPLTTLNFTVASRKKTATASINLAQCNLDYIETCTALTINATAAAVAKTVSITQNLQHCTTNAPQGISETDTTINIIATAASGYGFDAAPTIVFFDANGNILHTFTFTVLQSKISANVTFDVSQMLDFSDVETIVLTATAALIPTPPPSVNVDVTAENCTISGIPQNVDVETVLTLTATAANGYKFNTAPQIYFLDAHGDPNIIDFVLAVDGLTAAAVCDLSNYYLNGGETIEITAIADAITPYVDKYGSINVYKVNTNILAEFAAQRFFKEKINPSDTSGYFQLIDLGDYVVSVKRFYCNVGETLNAVIKAANYNTNINAETPQNDNFVVNCGTVEIPQYNLSIVDYQCEIKAFLPFVGFVNIPSDYCGEVVTLDYVINIITGDCVARLSSNGIAFDFVECTAANDITFKTNKENNYVTNAEFNLQLLKGLQPYITVKYFNDATAQLVNNDAMRGVLSTFSGYVRCSEIENLTLSIPRDVRTMIERELENGVYL